MMKLLPCIALGWILGTVCQLQQASIWRPQAVWTGAISGLALSMGAWFLSQVRRSQSASSAHRLQVVRCLLLGCLFGASFLLALSLINARCIGQDHRQLVREIEGQDLSLTGTVASLPPLVPHPAIKATAVATTAKESTMVCAPTPGTSEEVGEESAPPRAATDRPESSARATSPDRSAAWRAFSRDRKSTRLNSSH